jgi:hypothetical protein
MISVSNSRLWRLRLGIQYLLRLKQASGALLECLVGHLTWVGLVRRECLSILATTYAFIHKNPVQQTELWSSVRWELESFSAILPLLRADLAAPWHDIVTASDSCPAGVGVCYAQWDPEIVAAHRRCSERWRFDDENSIRARTHALSTSHNVTPQPCSEYPGSPKYHAANIPFDKVPSDHHDPSKHPAAPLMIFTAISTCSSLTPSITLSFLKFLPNS